MRKIIKYAEQSSLMVIEINRGDEIFKFNLSEEVQINESAIAKELKGQPNAYGFLTLLHTELLRKLALKKIEEKKAYASAYLKHKNGINKQTGRPNADDVAKQKAELDINYLSKQKQVIEMNANCNKIANCVKAFEQRGSLLQTLSANKRSEKSN